MVVLVGFASLIVDSPLEMWANVALVSPSVRVMLTKPFVLSAVGQADNVPLYKYNRAVDGRHGLPGLPGGNLHVFCSNQEDAEHKLRTTTCQGQQGGNAQNGGDGVSGADSKYSARDFESEVKRATQRGLWMRKKASSTDYKLLRTRIGSPR